MIEAQFTYTIELHIQLQFDCGGILLLSLSNEESITVSVDAKTHLSSIDNYNYNVIQL